MSLQQLILNKNSSSESSYLLDIKENPIIHFSIEGPKDFEFKLYYNGSFNTIMKIPNNEFLELSSKIINIEKVEFFISNLKDFEKVVFNYETIEKSNSSLNQASKDQVVQYIQGPPGKDYVLTAADKEEIANLISNEQIFVKFQDYIDELLDQPRDQAKLIDQVNGKVYTLFFNNGTLTAQEVL